MPFGETSFHWGDDVIFDNSVGTIDPDGGFEKITPRFIKEVLQDGLFTKCGYTARDIMIFGFGQGGMVASNIAGKMPQPVV